MRPEDVPVAERISADAFHAVDLDRRRVGDRPPERRPAARSQRWIDRTTGFLRTDGPGCWVAEVEDRVVGFATSFRRETLWCLATFAVEPGHQGHGLGRLLLDAAGRHASGCLRAMLAASEDPRALRRYVAAGFDLHPQLTLRGIPDASAAPSLASVREAVPGDRDEMDSLDRRVRGAARNDADHEALRAAGRPLVSTTRSASGWPK